MKAARARARLAIVMPPLNHPDREQLILERTDAKVREFYELIEVQEPGRDLGKMVMINSRALMQLLNRVQQLEARVTALEAP